jgi:hypothetical protein
MSTAAALRTAESVLGDGARDGAGRFMGEAFAGDLKDKYPKFPARNSPGEKPGGWNPRARIDEMEIDGVSAEVLYPTLGLRLFALEDAELQEACFRIANDWLIEYCQTVPGRRVGIPMILFTTSKMASESWNVVRGRDWSVA